MLKIFRIVLLLGCVLTFFLLLYGYNNSNMILGNKIIGNPHESINEKNNSVLRSNMQNYNSALSIEERVASVPKIKPGLYLNLEQSDIHFLATSKTFHKHLWSTDEYAKRRKEIQDHCSRRKISNRINLSRMIYDDRHKVLMCVVPKDACTTWKKYMLYLQGEIKNKSDIVNINSHQVVLTRSTKLNLLYRLPKNEIIRRLLTYTTFFVTRHPFERLVSAHSSKFTDRTRKDNPYKIRLGKSIALKNSLFHLKGAKYVYDKRNNTFKLKNDKNFEKLSDEDKESVLHYIDVMNTGKISFEELTNHIVEDKKTPDVHWRSQVLLCNPCAMNYDFVVRFEDLAKDSNWLLKYIQRNDTEDKVFYFDESHTSLINDTRTANAFSSLQPSTITALKKIYAEDFEIMGYSPDKY